MRYSSAQGIVGLIAGCLAALLLKRVFGGNPHSPRRPRTRTPPDSVDEVGMDSFPASDPPSASGLTPG